MSEATQLDDYIDETHSESDPSRSIVRKSGGPPTGTYPSGPIARSPGGPPADTYPSGPIARRRGSNGGDMDDVLKRLGAVESSVSELRVQVSGIAATMATKDDVNDLRLQVNDIAAKIPYLATNDALAEIKAIIPRLATSDALAEIKAVIPRLATNDALADIRAVIPRLATNDALAEVRAIIPHLATRADLNAGIGGLRAEMSAMETRMIKWMIATVLTGVGLAFTIAKFVH